MGRVDHWWGRWSSGEEGYDLGPVGGQIGLKRGYCFTKEGHLGGEEGEGCYEYLRDEEGMVMEAAESIPRSAARSVLISGGELAR